MGLGQFDSLGEYCGPHTASSVFLILLQPTGSEESGVLEVGSIPVAIPPSCQDMKTIALQLHKHEYSWEVKIIYTSEAVLRSQYSPWPSY